MRELFDAAARKAGSMAARVGIPYHENPLKGPLRRFARQWELGWSEYVARCTEVFENTRGGEPV
ncbi:hypothetical protein [Paraburkholderia sp. UCT2]|uniref:hypothetical protein n=1 Tax=Paraburkholderia sp. UCT2 TaxID=2615208 RepID=UPI0016552EF8|nr:hypothetical protein [Paraburkholderia sp. UCT2]MBC8730013.1 hypothetical protein [Paraburkholderia sp. UCT2]